MIPRGFEGVESLTLIFLTVTSFFGRLYSLAARSTEEQRSTNKDQPVCLLSCDLAAVNV